MLIRFLLLLFLLSSTCLWAQQDPQYSYYMYNTMAYNPGYAGSSGKICTNLLVRSQWMGFDGAPTTISANANSPFKLFGAEHGVGISFYNESIGEYSNNSFNLNYAYRFSIRNGKLGIGLSLGALNNKLDGAKFLTEGYNDVVHSTSPDPSVPTGKEEIWLFPTMTAGLFYNSDDVFFGVSATNLLGTSQAYEGTGSSGENAGGTESGYDTKQHYYLTAGYTFQLNNPSFELQPSVLVKSDAASSQIDLNTNLIYNKRVWGGVSVRVNQISLLAGLELPNGLKIGLAYDIDYSGMSYNNNSGTMEFYVGYCFDLVRERIPQKYRSIRYL